MDANAYSPPKSEVARPAISAVAQSLLWLELAVQVGTFAGCLRLSVPVWAYALLVVVEYFVLAAAKVRYSARTQFRSEFMKFDLVAHEEGDAIRAYLSRLTVLLEAQGYRALGVFQSMGASKGANTCVAVFENAAGERANAAVVYSTAAAIASSYVSFQTHFSDGTDLETSHLPNPSIWPAMPGLMSERFPGVTDPARLALVHRALVGRFANLRVVAPVPSPNGIAAAFAEDHDRVFSRLVEVGLYWRDDAAACYRPTWRGSFSQSMKLSWPIKDLRAAALRRREKRLLHELGLEASTEGAVSYDPASKAVLRKPLLDLLTLYVPLYFLLQRPSTLRWLFKLLGLL